MAPSKDPTLGGHDQSRRSMHDRQIGALRSVRVPAARNDRPLGSEQVYGLLILGADSAWADEVFAHVDAAATAVLQRHAMERLDELPPTDEGPAVVVYLGDARAAADPQIAAALEHARSGAIGVLPVVHDLQRARQHIPEVLSRLNAMSWDENAGGVIQGVLTRLGIAERERKLFLSYRRQETSALALQLRRELSERVYDVFLDRFSVPPGDDFQRRLDIELADKAFVLLLESESAIGSPWVQHEVTYALSHRIAVLALTMPDAQPDARFEVIDDAFRIELANGDFDDAETAVGRELRSDALAAVLTAVELRYARQLRRRRAELLGSVADWLFQHSYSTKQVADWAIASTSARGSEHVWLVTPRAPVPTDLRELDRLRTAVGVDCEGTVIHDTPILDADDLALIEWITDNRPLAAARLQTVPDLLAA